MPNLFMVDLNGTEISQLEEKILQHPNVGAVILFSRNFKNPDQLKKLVEDIHSVRSDIFIAVDHEGGMVQRFKGFGIKTLPAARVYGQFYDINPEAGLKFAFKEGKIMAKDLLELGIDLSLAPVVDLDGESEVIGKLDRAFHSNPAIVEQIAAAFIAGMNEEGMPAVLKHFPGHGSCLSDSHVSTPVYKGSKEKLRETDLKPFAGLIKEQKAAAIMPAHIIYESIDMENPAGFSEICLQGILRSELGFQGLILSDCLGMGGASIVGDMKQRAERALKAGCDMLVICNQSRELLCEVLEKVNPEPNKESEKRLEIFKQQMVRFKNLEKITKMNYPFFNLNINDPVYPKEKNKGCEETENINQDKTNSI
jgi:beta-N-acetylhexosaminidase